MNARELVLNSLLRHEKNGRFSNLENDSTLKKAQLNDADRRLYSALFFGVVQRKISLDHLIKSYSNIPGSKISDVVRNVLRMGLYQIRYMDRIPRSAAVDEAVKLSKKRQPKSAGFVNAILRRACVDTEDRFLVPDDPLSELSVRYSYPQWMVKSWIDAYGKERTLEIMEAQNCPPPLFLRVNTLKTDRSSLMNKLEAIGVECQPSALSEYGISCKDASAALESDLFKEGYFFIQDAASQLSGILLDPGSGDTVIDLCSCPGGKSFGAAMMTGDTGRILSFDIHESKLSLVKSGALRLGIKSLSVSAQDASVLNESLIDSADAVICDVPCSGLGVIAKKPDVREKSEEDTKKLWQIQSAILNNAALYTKPGGKLMYSTCTLLPRENEDVTNAFLSSHPGFRRAGKAYPMTLFPERGKNDGFFIDLFTRTE